MSEISEQIAFYKNLLIKEAKTRSMSDPSSGVPKAHFNEVFENCFLGDAEIAQNRQKLQELGITHVLNASKGEKISQVNTNQHFYASVNIQFFGCSLIDVESCNIEKYFDVASDFISSAIDKNKGKILVHCYMGISRSATLIIAYLIKERKVRLEEALRILIRKRMIWPNDGFLAQLIKWDRLFDDQVPTKNYA